MKRKAVSGMMLLTFLLLSLFALAFGGIDGKIYRVYGTSSKSDRPLPASNRLGFAADYLGEKGWSFDNAREWGSFSYADKDSAELVIGVKEPRPAAYDQLNQIIATNGGQILKTVSIKEATQAFVVDVSFDLIPSLVQTIEVNGLAKYIEPNMRFQAQFIPNDPDWSLQWGPRKIEADFAWNTTIGNPSVLVAVVDTGIDWTHPDLAANYVALGYDWVNMDSDPLDDAGHGTHCAGIIAATLNNEVGIAGLAQVKIMAEKGLDQSGFGYEDDLANAIVHAVDQGADIISLSWGGGESSLIYDAVKYAHDAGILVVASAGNWGGTMKSYPAAFEEVIAVTAAAQDDKPAGFTSFGDWVEVAAPGVDIYSTMPTYSVTLTRPPYNKKQNYDYLSGTSMACPHVVGVAALIWSRFPYMTRDQVRAQLRYTAEDLGDEGFDIYYGFGRVNARKSVEQAPPDHDLLVLGWKTPQYYEIGHTAIFNASVLNFGTSNETDIEAQLVANGSSVNSTFIASLSSGSSTTIGLSWVPSVEGTYNVTFHVLPVPDEKREQNNQITKIVTVVAPPTEIDWKLLATDPDEGNGTNLRMICGQRHSSVIFFKVEHYRAWTTIKDIDVGIFIDSDHNPETGCWEGLYPKMNTGIGADYLITVGYEGNEMCKWISTPEVHGWDFTNPISLAYVDAPDHSNVFVVGVFVADVQPTQGVTDVAVCDIPSNWDWMPDSGSFVFLITFYSRTYLPNEWIGGGVPMGWHGDDESWPYPLPFEFPFYGTNYTSIYISSNGLISLINPDSSKKNSISELVNKMAIAPAWDDWTTYEPYDIYVWENSTNIGIRWHVRAPDSGAIADFEAIISVDGVIQFNYARNDGSISATVGISNGVGDTLAVDVTNLNYTNTIVFTPFIIMHDIAVVNVTPYKTTVCQGYSIIILATVFNKGIYTETFNVTAYANTTVIETLEVTLTRGESSTIGFTWNTTGFVKGRHTISAKAARVSGEVYAADNTLADGVVAVTTPGDVNADGIVNIMDAAGISAHWFGGAVTGPLGPDPNFDINNDGVIGILDASIVSAYWTGPPKGPLAP